MLFENAVLSGQQRPSALGGATVEAVAQTSALAAASVSTHDEQQRLDKEPTRPSSAARHPVVPQGVPVYAVICTTTFLLNNSLSLHTFIYIVRHSSSTKLSSLLLSPSDPGDDASQQVK